MENSKKPGFDIQIVLLVLTVLIVLIVYSPSLGREWQFFDERTFYGEGLFPFASSIGELIEIIKTYAFTYHIGSQNTYFSNIVTVRANVLGAILNMIVMFLFKGNALFYHLLQISIHLINTVLVWLIFHTLLKKEETNKKIACIICSLFTLVWALHPTNIESVLLGTNWTSLLTYSIFFFLIYKAIGLITKSTYKLSFKSLVTYTILFLISLLISEYSYALPFIIFFLAFLYSLKDIGNIKESAKNAFYICLPFVTGILIFVSYYLIKFVVLTETNPISNKYIDFSPERFFWFTPQIFIYFFKLFFFPQILSLYQTTYVKLADSFFSPYAIVSSIVFLLFTIFPLVLFFIFQSKQKSYLFLTIYIFLFSLFPFLHIVSPTYCLIAERYCYIPLFALLFITLIILTEYKTVRFFKIIIPVLLITLIPLSIRTALRMQDWKDTVTLFSSDLKYELDDLHKGQIYSVLIYHLNETGELFEMKKLSVPAFIALNKAIETLKKEDKTNEPKTLKYYGLDSKSLLLRAAFAISDIRFNFLNEPADFVLKLYEPYIKDNIKNAGTSQINIYAKLLNALGRNKEGVKILEEGRKAYPYSPQLIYTLSTLYLDENELDKAEKIIDEGYKVYPSYARMLLKKTQIAELKNDTLNHAKYQYLLGLRVHSEQNYQKAVQLYLAMRKLPEAKKTLQKLLYTDDKNPTTLLLLSKYYNLSGNKNQIIPTLEKAYLNAKIRDFISQEPRIYESILLSLVSFNIEKNDPNSAKVYIRELDKLPQLLAENQAFLSSVKKRLDVQ